MKCDLQWVYAQIDVAIQPTDSSRQTADEIKRALKEGIEKELREKIKILREADNLGDGIIASELEEILGNNSNFFEPKVFIF